MTKARASAIVARAVRILAPDQKARLRRCMAEQTPILCGPDAETLYARDGAACPEALACTTSIPKREVAGHDFAYGFGERRQYIRWRDTLEAMQEATGEAYLVALKVLNQAEVRKAIRAGLKNSKPKKEVAR